MEVSTAARPVRVLAHGITRDGRQVLLHAEGDVSSLNRWSARRNAERWARGLRPNRLGIRKEVDVGGSDN